MTSTTVSADYHPGAVDAAGLPPISSGPHLAPDHLPSLSSSRLLHDPLLGNGHLDRLPGSPLALGYTTTNLRSETPHDPFTHSYHLPDPTDPFDHSSFALGYDKPSNSSTDVGGLVGGDTGPSLPFSLPSVGADLQASTPSTSAFEGDRTRLTSAQPQRVYPTFPATQALSSGKTEWWHVDPAGGTGVDTAAGQTPWGKGKARERLDLEEIIPRHSALLVNELFFDYVSSVARCSCKALCS
jgi:hypothetical protein